MMTITYQVKKSIYVNLTNRCPCACTFCLRNNASGVFGSGPLWLEREPTLKEVEDSLAGWDYTKFGEVVFCGYGEPTERLDVLLAAARFIRDNWPTVKIRVNTNGLSDLIAGKSTASRFAGLVDVVSISLNTDDPEEYLSVCRPKFGPAAYPAMLKFAADVKQFVPDVVMTVVDVPVTSLEQQERCRRICDGLGVRLRVRPYEAKTTSHTTAG